MSTMTTKEFLSLVKQHYYAVQAEEKAQHQAQHNPTTAKVTASQQNLTATSSAPAKKTTPITAKKVTATSSSNSNAQKFLKVQPISNLSDSKIRIGGHRTTTAKTTNVPKPAAKKVAVPAPSTPKPVLENVVNAKPSKPKEMTAAEVKKHLAHFQALDDKLEFAKEKLAIEQAIQDEELAQIEELKAKIAEAEKREEATTSAPSTPKPIPSSSSSIKPSKPKEMTATQVRKHLAQLQVFDDRIADTQREIDAEVAKKTKLEAELVEAELIEAKAQHNCEEIDRMIGFKKSAQALPMIGGIKITTESEGKQVTDYAFRECILKNQESITYSETLVDDKSVKHIIIHDFSPIVKFLEKYKATTTKCDFRKFEISNIMPLITFLTNAIINSEFTLVGNQPFNLNIGCELADDDINILVKFYKRIPKERLSINLTAPNSKASFLLKI